MIWKEKYKVGVQLIDTQHEELFKRVADFLETVRSPKKWDEKKEKVTETLDFMKEYVVSHFHDEEAYQKEINYPSFEAHRKIHNDMVKYVSDIAIQFEKEGYNEKLIQAFAGRLMAWLINHVASEDQKIADYANQREAK